MICEKCKHEIGPEELKCPYCGADNPFALQHVQNMEPISLTSAIGESVQAAALYRYVRTTPSFSNPTAKIPPGNTSKSHGKAPSSFTTPRRDSAPVAASTENTAMDS